MGHGVQMKIYPLQSVMFADFYPHCYPKSWLQETKLDTYIE